MTASTAEYSGADIHTQAANQISARIDALPNTTRVWLTVGLLSLGSFCEIYDANLTPYLTPGLLRSGIFETGTTGLFGLSDAATFIASTFAGLWIGTMVFSALSDRAGRLPALRLSMAWYVSTTVIMACQGSALGIDLFRFLTGIGMGVQIIAIDCAIAETTPKAMRGRAFAASAAIQFCAAPIAAVSAAYLIPREPMGMAGWRWLCLMPAAIAIVVSLFQRRLRESPRWLAQHGRLGEAEAVVARLERETHTEPRRNPAVAREAALIARLPHLSRQRFAGRLTMMASVNFLQAIGYYGFSLWVPSLLQAKGVNLSNSLIYSAAIALSFPLAPVLFFFFSDRIERKYQFILGCIGAAVFGCLFAAQTSPAMWILFGILVTVSGNLMGSVVHAYQSEIFPTQGRARAVGFVYSFTRLSTIFSGYIVAFLLARTGVPGVFAFICGALLCAALIVGIFGPRTRGLALEEIS